MFNRYVNSMDLFQGIALLADKGWPALMLGVCAWTIGKAMEHDCHFSIRYERTARRVRFRLRAGCGKQRERKGH